MKTLIALLMRRRSIPVPGDTHGVRYYPDGYPVDVLFTRWARRRFNKLKIVVCWFRRSHDYKICDSGFDLQTRQVDQWCNCCGHKRQMPIAEVSDYDLPFIG